jgi:hypothetical protein
MTRLPARSQAPWFCSFKKKLNRTPLFLQRGWAEDYFIGGLVAWWRPVVAWWPGGLVRNFHASHHERKKSFSSLRGRCS